jgi:DHA1 family tetracycline resistance protein-like MFS transporter
MKISPLLSIFLVVLVDVLGLTIILPLLPFYAESLGATPLTVGLLVSAFAICQLMVGPPLGHLSDRVGRRPVLLISQFGTFVSFLILASAQSLEVVFLARIINGLTAGNLTVAQAAISDVTRPEERAKAFGLIGVAFSIGFMVGPAAAGFLAVYGNHYPILAAAALSAASIAATYFLLPAVAPHPDPHQEKGSRLKLYASALKDGNLAPMLLQFFVFTFAFTTFISGFALFAERRLTYNAAPFGPREVGYMFAFLGLLGILTQGIIGKLVKTFGESRLVQMGFAMMAAGFVVMGRVQYIPYVLLAITLITLGNAILRPSITSLITMSAAKHRQGMVIGLMQSLMSVGQIVAPLVGGLLIEHQFLTAWAWAGGLVCAVGLSLITIGK